MDRNTGTDGAMGEDDEELLRLRDGLRRQIVEARTSSKGEKGSKVALNTRPVDLTSETLDAYVRENDKVVVDVWAPWCAPCRYLSPIVEQLAGEMAGHVAFGKLNSDEEPTVAMKYGIQGIPTLLLFKGGKLAGRLVGAMPKEALQAKLKGPLGL